MKPRTRTFTPSFAQSRSLRWLAIALAAALLPVFAGAARAETMSWTGMNYLVSSDPAAGTFVRRGVAKFANGEVAVYVTEGRITGRDAKSMTYDVTLVYTFEDGSTLRQQGTGRNDVVAPGKVAQSGSGRLVEGTGRFAGIRGTTESTGRALSEKEGVTEFKAEYTMPGKW